MTALGAACVALALVVLALARRARRRGGLAGGRIRAQDVDLAGARRLARPLSAPALGLVGRPDYLLAAGPGWVPVEVKPTRRARTPRPGDLLQLAAYCALVEAETGAAVPHGVLVYADGRRWIVPFDAARRAALAAALEALRADARAAEVPRSHASPRRCAACGLRHGCAQRLA